MVTGSIVCTKILHSQKRPSLFPPLFSVLWVENIQRFLVLELVVSDWIWFSVSIRLWRRMRLLMDPPNSIRCLWSLFPFFHLIFTSSLCSFSWNWQIVLCYFCHFSCLFALPHLLVTSVTARLEYYATGLLQLQYFESAAARIHLCTFNMR